MAVETGRGFKCDRQDIEDVTLCRQETYSLCVLLITEGFAKQICRLLVADPIRSPLAEIGTKKRRGRDRLCCGIRARKTIIPRSLSASRDEARSYISA